MIIVSRKPIMAGYQLLVFKMLYIYVLLICDTLINYYLLTTYLHIVHFYFKLVMRQLIYPNSCIRLITCENGYFAVDDVALIYATSVQRLALKRKRREY